MHPRAPVVTRRRLLTAAGAAAGGAATGLLLPPTALATPGRAPVTTAGRTAALLPGQPPSNSLYYGSIVSTKTTVQELERDLGSRLGSRRNYHHPREIAQLLRRAREDVAAGRFSVLSIKAPGSWRAVYRGEHDHWLHQILDGLAGVNAPMAFSIHHEPENEVGGRGSGMTPDWHRRMTQRLVRMAADRAPQVNIIQILMGWTFNRKSHRHADRWVADNVSMFGVDAYNWWSPAHPHAQKWVSFGTLINRVKKFSGDKPIIVAEYGTRTDPARPGRAAQWMLDAYEYALANNVMVMDYFNTAPAGIREPFILDAERLAAYEQCLHDPRSVALAR